MVASYTHYQSSAKRVVHTGGDFAATYQVSGNGSPLVLVPALAGGIELLNPLVEHLSKYYRVYCYQLRGENQALFERSYSLDHLIDDLNELITHLGLERPGLLGVSFGGAVALRYAARFPNRLSYLALQGASSQLEPSLVGDVVRKVLDEMPLPIDSPFVNQFFNLLIGRKPEPQDHIEQVVEACWRTDQSVMAHRFSMLTDYNLGHTVSAIKVPTMVMSGSNDVLVPQSLAQRFSEQLPRGQFCKLGDGGHFAFITHAQQMAHSIKRFTRQLVFN